MTDTRTQSEKYDQLIGGTAAFAWTVADRLELWQLLCNPLLLRAFKDLLGTTDDMKNRILGLKLGDPAQAHAASHLQGTINGRIEVISQLIDMSLDKEPKDEPRSI